MSNFWESLTAEKLINGYVGIESAKANADAMRYVNAPTVQRSTLHSPESSNAEDAFRSGNAPDPAATQDYWSRIPKPLLYGSMVLLGGALLLKATK